MLLDILGLEERGLRTIWGGYDSADEPQWSDEPKRSDLSEKSPFSRHVGNMSNPSPAGHGVDMDGVVRANNLQTANITPPADEVAIPSRLSAFTGVPNDSRSRVACEQSNTGPWSPL